MMMAEAKFYVINEGTMRGPWSNKEDADVHLQENPDGSLWVTWEVNEDSGEICGKRIGEE
jgi:hypothetical protein